MTYWHTTSTTPCSVKVCKCQADVCFIRSDLFAQMSSFSERNLIVLILRLDMTRMELYPPNTDYSLTTATQVQQLTLGLLYCSFYVRNKFT